MHNTFSSAAAVIAGIVGIVLLITKSLFSGITWSEHPEAIDRVPSEFTVAFIAVLTIAVLCTISQFL